MAAAVAVKVILVVRKRLAVKVEAVKERHTLKTLLVKMVKLILAVALVEELVKLAVLDLWF
jgi:DNA-directed RNA polymerase subunit L